MAKCLATADVASNGHVLLSIECILDWPHESDHVARLSWPVDPDDRTLEALDRELDG